MSKKHVQEWMTATDSFNRKIEKLVKSLQIDVLQINEQQKEICSFHKIDNQVINTLNEQIERIEKLLNR